jgi:uncharacterized protein (TIGR03118 family)
MEEERMRSVVKFLKPFALLGIAVFLLPSLTFAQYLRTDLVSNTGTAQNPGDPNLVNGWGLVSSTTSPFWVSDNGTGKSTLYSVSNPLQGPTATKLGLVVTVSPAVAGGQGTPTGIVANESAKASTDFTVTDPVTHKSGKAAFIFSTLDGTISVFPGVGPNGPDTATIAVDRSGFGATYTGLAFASSGSQNFLYAADDGPNRRVDMFDSTFTFVKSFSDSGIPRDFTPYGIQTINGQVWVTYTALNKAQGGFVDVFAPDGTLVKHFAVQGPLHSPWGIALAPDNFGPMSNAILITNNTPRGRINAFDPATGAFLGPLRDASNKPIEIDDIWAIQFGQGAGANGATNQLFFTAGPNNYANGLFGVITVGE